MQKMTKNNRMIRHIGCVLCAALLCIVTVLLAQSAMKEAVPSLFYEDVSMADDKVSVLDEVQIEAFNSKIDGLKVSYNKKKKDPNLVITFPQEEGRRVCGVELVLTHTLPYDMPGSLFYPNEENEYDGNHRSNYKLYKGQTSYFFEVPEDVAYNLDRIRIDIDDSYEIEDLLISEKPLIREYVPVDHYPRSGIAVRFVVLFLLMELLCYFWPEIRRAAESIRKRRRQIMISLLILAGAGAAGAVGAYILFHVAGKQFTWFWALSAALCCAVSAYELYLLLRRDASSESTVKRKQTFSWSKVIFWGCIVVFCGLIGFEWIDGYLIKPQYASMNSFQLLYLFAVVQTVLLALLYHKYILTKAENSISFLNVYIFVFFLLGLAYMLFFLPYVSPDEPSHYVSSYRVANILLGKSGEWGSDRLLMRMEDYLMYDAYEKELTPQYFMQINDGISLFAKETGDIAVQAPIVTNAIFCYLTTGLGIAVARVFHLSAYLTFMMGRLGNLVFFTLVLGYLMKKIPFGRTALFTIAMMPMTLHMVASYSYDVTTFCFVALFVVQVMCMISTPEKISRRDYILCVIYGILMAPSKMIYIPLLLMVLLVPDERMGANRRQAWRRKLAVVGISLAATAVIMLIVNLMSADSTLRKMAEQSVTANYLSYGDHEMGYTFTWILGHLGEYILMVVRTLIKLADSYFFGLVGSSLGWLTIPTPHVYSILSFVMFLLAVNIEDDVSKQVRIGTGRKLWILLLGAGSVFCALLVMTVSWTPMSSDYITGVQGRYFTPLLVPLIWLMRNYLIQVKSEIRKYIVFFAAGLNIWVLVYIFTQMLVTVVD